MHRSGGGKSTIVSLLMRFYDCRGGRLRLDGRDVAELNVKDYRGLFGIVAQDTPLFARSIRKNIAYGHPGADLDDADADEALGRAVEAAAASRKLPDAQAKSGCVRPPPSSALFAQVATPQQTACVRPA